MTRPRLLPFLILSVAMLLVATLNFNGRPASSAAEPVAASGNDKDAVAGQIKELQKQVAELQTQVSALKTPRIVAAGTATIKLPGIQDNKQKVRVKLPADIAAQLGSKCMVQLTNRFPTGGSFFVPYWKPATDGFDIHVADPSMSGDYQICPNDKQPYSIDWIVVQK